MAGLVLAYFVLLPACIIKALFRLFGSIQALLLLLAAFALLPTCNHSSALLRLYKGSVEALLIKAL